ncbi:MULTISPECIES: aromatic acid exporter family protein [unclassified Streptococcus]|uniref:FUSC family protein n=1 Tax=unclassified Streptococcus TaxID=2608887 RepID=UPI0011B6EBCF|nr:MULTISPECIES: aromatic acid exporter family protein [unclassified Streptococcus]TWT11193.1 aromatic acid exporter family protein [Streptococcus sp. sy004]TWT16175.1 aromatic acid exporter family protein [Streptococcus sp. sy010]
MDFRQFKFDKKQFRLGLRTFKTGLSVFLVLLLFKLFGWEGTQIAALTAVFSLREDFGTSLQFGISRILANSIGGFFAVIFFSLTNLLGGSYWLTLFTLPILTMLTIMTNVAMNNKAGVIGGVAALLIITLSIPDGDTILYVFVRIFETFVGVFIAIMVNADVDWLKNRLKKKSM